jgi:hypothetical protein
MVPAGATAAMRLASSVYTAYDKPDARHSSTPPSATRPTAASLPAVSIAPPATAVTVPSHHVDVGGLRCTAACSSPAQIGPLPSAMAVPTATPVCRMPAKNARL